MFVVSDYKWIRHDGANMREIVSKRQNGIKAMMFENKILVWSVFSPRPYKLGQSCDGTIDTCVFALYYDFCKKKNLNPDEIYAKAYKTQESSDWGKIIKEAELEGVEYPKKWNKKAFEGLLESLTEINNHSLVEVLEKHQSMKEKELFNKITSGGKNV